MPPSGANSVSPTWCVLALLTPRFARSAIGRKPSGSSASLQSQASATRICCRQPSRLGRGASRSTNRGSSFCAHAMSRLLTSCSVGGSDGRRRSLRKPCCQPTLSAQAESWADVVLEDFEIVPSLDAGGQHFPRGTQRNSTAHCVEKTATALALSERFDVSVSLALDMVDKFDY